MKIFTTKDKKTVTTEHDRNSMSRGLGKAHIVEWLNLIWATDFDAYVYVGLIYGV